MLHSIHLQLRVIHSFSIDKCYILVEIDNQLHNCTIKYLFTESKHLIKYSSEIERNFLFDITVRRFSLKIIKLILLEYNNNR